MPSRIPAEFLYSGLDRFVLSSSLSVPHPPMSSQKPQTPPMSEAEYRDVIRGSIAQWVTALFFAGVGAAGSAYAILPILGVFPASIAGLFFGLVLGGKFFPDAGKLLTVRCRNYRRKRAGKPLIDDDDPSSEYFSDYGRG